MKKSEYFALKFENDTLIFLDQTKLPFQETYIQTDDYKRIASAIERLEIRGAPAIGVAAAYGLALSIKNCSRQSIESTFQTALDRLANTRPTAVNLFASLNEIRKTFIQNVTLPDVYSVLKECAVNLHNRDINNCEKIGKNGLAIFRKKSNVLTHCNTGKLATSGEGTAFNIIRLGFERGLVNHVYVDETRPLYQGLRLTAFELEKNEIPFSVQTDSMAAALMQQNKIDLVIVGADRIALNGDTANKIGTFNLAVLCNYHDIPFYVAAPSSSIDRTISSGKEIIIEYRKKSEVLSFNSFEIAPDYLDVFNPAFDVTPSHLIKGIITEDQVYLFPYNFIL
ncbi:MAG: S-methyl-5-thioribose-1-phosphate isomerase [Ignavibacteriaceae bacterium]|nr:S-methyl-5-thioribose-1-phosphate isomerase [Ignavibacteriaceae bacterium]